MLLISSVQREHIIIRNNCDSWKKITCMFLFTIKALSECSESCNSILQISNIWKLCFVPLLFWRPFKDHPFLFTHSFVLLLLNLLHCIIICVCIYNVVFGKTINKQTSLGSVEIWFHVSYYNISLLCWKFLSLNWTFLSLKIPSIVWFFPVLKLNCISFADWSLLIQRSSALGWWTLTPSWGFLDPTGGVAPDPQIGSR